MSRVFSLAWRLQARVLFSKLGHQTVYLIAIKTCDLSDVLVTQAGVAAFGPLHKNAKASRFGSIPTNSATGSTLTVLCKTVVELGLNAPVSAPPSATVFDVTGRFHCG